jgi:hypothetical protein
MDIDELIIKFGDYKVDKSHQESKPRYRRCRHIMLEEDKQNNKGTETGNS